MRLNPGARLGPYEIVGPLGAGGMGEVYRARDTRLDRTVAIKVLHPELSANPGLRRRFEREARAISSLNHPHICTLFDLGHEEGIDFLVMEYLEGETLARRLTRGPLPLGHAMRCAVDLAGALDSAHRQGVIHRDLKPGNIMLTRSGAKILDFGLARSQTEKVAPPAEGLTSLPTEPRQPPLTEEGTILGTTHYMAPEQLEGKEVDARTDLFSLGEVIYEMVTGASPFKGVSRASLIGAILHVEPPALTSIQPLAPPALERAIRRCLAKDPEERWQTARDLASELQWIAGGGAQGVQPGTIAAPHRFWTFAGWALAILALFAVAVIAVRPPGERPVAAPSVVFSVPPPEDATFPDHMEQHNLAFSPDGHTLAFVANRNAQSLLWLRVLDEPSAKPLAGTEGAVSPFWSPDSRMIAYFADGKLKKVPVSGGPSQSICAVSGNNTGAWGREGIILFTQHFTEHELLYQVPDSGGEPVAVLDSNRTSELNRPRWPTFLPDGRHYLFLAWDPEGEPRLYGGLLGSHEIKIVAKLRSLVAYMPPGRLLYVSEGNLVMQPFDPNELRFTGEPVPIVERLPNFISGWAPFSISENGALAYRAETNPTRLLWRDRNGRPVGTVGHEALYRSFRLSPDGEKVAMEIKDSSTGTTDLWLYELSRDILTQFTHDPALESNAVWSPDGRLIVFTSHGGAGGSELRLKAVTGDDTEGVSLTQAFGFASDWSPDGRLVLYHQLDPKIGWQMWTIPMVGERTAALFRKSPFQQGEGKFSMDGRWLAFVSAQSGSLEVYVMPARGSGDRWQVSPSGGLEPRWRRDGKELFYRASDGSLMAVPVNVGAKFETGRPISLFKIESSALGNTYDVSPDGQRFLVNPGMSSGTVPITIVVNWPAQTKALKTK